MKWFEIWFEDMQSLINTMTRNMQADLDAGYDPNGRRILTQKLAILDKQERFEKRLDDFQSMEDAKVNRWCYYDLKRRGAIN